MLYTTTVLSVSEHNDCSGRKTIEVSSVDDDNNELRASRFRLSSTYMPPHHKLALSTVSPTDTIQVNYLPIGPNPLLMGEFVDVLDDVHNRVPMCRCGSTTVSDGSHIYCPNDECGLSVMSRLKRLASTSFFTPQMLQDVFDGFTPREILTPDDLDGLSVYTSDFANTPFTPIIKPEFWGNHVTNIEDELVLKRFGSVSLATFLVDELFTSFIDRLSSKMVYNSEIFGGIFNFYGHMDELIQRRSPDDVRQNRFLKMFLWSLGLETLRGDVVDRMIQYEATCGFADDPLLIYGYFFTHPTHTAKELGLHPLEARAISQEFFQRRYEMADIFRRYTSKSSFQDIFNSPTG